MAVDPQPEDVDPDPNEAARRVRAAIAYAGVSQADLAGAMGKSIPTIARMTNRKGADGVRNRPKRRKPGDCPSVRNPRGVPSARSAVVGVKKAERPLVALKGRQGSGPPTGTQCLNVRSPDVNAQMRAMPLLLVRHPCLRP